ncbi:MAG: lipoprotein intramolecular transacylase Lit [Candidatus Limnocylindria bacterium]
MARAPWVIGLLFGLSLSLIILLLGPLLLFNPLFTSALQVRHGVAAELDATQAEVERVTSSYLADIYLDGDFGASLDGDGPLLGESERSHMTDVSRLVRVLAGILVAALVLAGLTGAWLRHEPRRQGRIMLLASGAVGTMAVVLAVVFAVAFEPAFLAFHEVFFPPGSYLFATGSELIVLFPEPFWFDAALLAGASIVLVAVAVSLIGLWRWRSARTTTRQS